ncbi:MAG: hypothetical protein IPF56_23615 [Chloroflexi bacterium]|nr:hypothetical protein [Chloroflexota bacterium]
MLNSRQVYWFKKGYAPDDKTDAKDSFYVTEKLRTSGANTIPGRPTAIGYDCVFTVGCATNWSSVDPREELFLVAHVSEVQ